MPCCPLHSGCATPPMVSRGGPLVKVGLVQVELMMAVPSAYPVSAPLLWRMHARQTARVSSATPPVAEVERTAARGRATIKLPRPMLGRSEPHFSLAGLKTALRQEAIKRAPLDDQTVADLCASFQEAVADVIQDRTARAMDLYATRLGEKAQRALVVAGGVAANQRLRGALQDVARARGFSLVVPPPALCTDNGAMIAWAGTMRLARGLTDDLTAPARARWPLDPDAPPALGAGVKA